ncbi:MAG: helix-turn-helix transcriptional regulator [Pseudomonadota bacterium]
MHSQAEFCVFFLAVMTEQHRRDICTNLARILQAERLRKGLSMTALAAKAGLSQQMVSYVERDMRNPTIDTLLRMAGALEVDLAGILKRAMKARP